MNRAERGETYAFVSGSMLTGLWDIFLKNTDQIKTG